MKDKVEEGAVSDTGLTQHRMVSRHVKHAITPVLPPGTGTVAKVTNTDHVSGEPSSY